ncbi:MAG: ABC transporter ATP-binding protein [Chitinophagaceae bacterium]|nr:ABC transporter ATP-binding protein [Chitinophagaceae bacterium]MCW5905036.1 ABC transporter ATP-binding protein [Chitinophagaceae bacterium]
MQFPLLAIKHLSINFSTMNGRVHHAVNDVNITIHKNEIVAIVGESGSGKSVTALSVLQLLPKQIVSYPQGEINFYLNNQQCNLLTYTNEQLQQIRGNHIAMIFQEPMSSLNPVITCGKQVLEAIILHKKISYEEAKKQTIHLFEKVKLSNPSIVFNRYPHQLSGGQKQRVMIAMAICCKPDLLICDEPTTALDVTVQKEILQLIKDIQQENKMGVIFITHDLGVVSEIADRIVVMYKGNMVEQNTTQQIFSNPTHAYTKALLACRPALYSKGTKLPVVANFLHDISFTPSLQENSNIASSNNEKEILISVKNLQVYFSTRKSFTGKELANFKAVDEVSFDIYKGETLGLVGESGCGKTTLGRSILKLIQPTAGSIMYNNKDITYATNQQLQKLRKEMQLIFQDPYASLNPMMTVGEAITEPLHFHNKQLTNNQAKEKTIYLLEKVGLTANDYKKYPHEFSGGQRQRIVIARALILQPAFIVCDESVSALDVSVQAQVLNLLNDLKQEFRFTALFISHDLSVIKYVSDRIMVMKNGKIEEIGIAEKIFNNPQSQYTQQLIDAIPILRK